MIKKVFGIISYFPDTDSDYHTEMRRDRTRRFKELLLKLEELWPNVDIMIIAQNWQDFELPDLKNKITTFYYGKLGILGARRELRRRFLDSNYDYLIMFDDDARVGAENPQLYLDEIDKHPKGVGTLRHNRSPLQFFAISKYIYNQIDMPDIDPEKGEGFEDDIFVAQCFAKFPDLAYDFPAGIVTETSFKYTGPGKCASTWSREKKYDWTKMRTYTIDTVAALENPVVEPEIDNVPVDKTIDLLITYVNGSDSQWLKDYVKTTRTHNPASVRFRSWGTLKYLLRGVEKYMPFIRNVVLILARPSQVPVWLNKENVRIVYHDEFIPKDYLPTFNSCTIESFFWNIKDLSDRIIYFNDDMFPIAPLKGEDFFSGNVPHIKFTNLESYNERNIFRSQCRSGLDMITKALNLPKLDAGKIIRPYHISGVITKEGLQKIKELCEPALKDSVTALRCQKNVNQYIYAYYQYFTNNYINEVVDYKYFEVVDKAIKDILAEISKGSYKMICLNDSEKLKDYPRARYQIQTGFERKFPIKSHYEI